MNKDIIIGLADVSLFLANIGKKEYHKTVEDACNIIQRNRWIPVTERLPENANHKGAYCPRYRVLTQWGETYGWYNPDKGCWYFLLWYLDGIGVDFIYGDDPKLAHEKPGATVVTHWMPEPINGGNL